ncbi:MAG: LysM peptidoglycan-binding domain-containing protein, partial [Staphylococcus epidermidis]|nr:LysM peptidoglycan-binding domain-containing protein [Staphylococcus epidermidis]
MNKSPKLLEILMNNKTFLFNGKEHRPKNYLRAIAHMNIGLQVAFPLAVSFTPVMVARAETEEKKHSVIISSPKTDIYILQPGDSPKLIAEKYQISIAELKILNQYRTFAHGFESVSAGDEIDVP